MSDSRGKFDWQQTSSLMAMVANIMHDPKKGKPAKPDDFNPYVKPAPIPIVPITMLKEAFIKDKK